MLQSEILIFIFEVVYLLCKISSLIFKIIFFLLGIFLKFLKYLFFLIILIFFNFCFNFFLDKLVLNQNHFLLVFCISLVHKKFSITYFTAFARCLFLFIFIWRELVLCKPSLFMETFFTRSRSTKITILFLFFLDIFFARIAILRIYFRSCGLTQTEYGVMGVKIKFLYVSRLNDNVDFINIIFILSSFLHYLLKNQTVAC